MTALAVFQQVMETLGFHFDGIVIISGSEGLRVIPSVLGLGQPFANEGMWHMAVIAGGDIVMAAFFP